MNWVENGKQWVYFVTSSVICIVTSTLGAAFVVILLLVFFFFIYIYILNNLWSHPLFSLSSSAQTHIYELYDHKLFAKFFFFIFWMIITLTNNITIALEYLQCSRISVFVQFQFLRAEFCIVYDQYKNGCDFDKYADKSVHLFQTNKQFVLSSNHCTIIKWQKQAITFCAIRILKKKQNQHFLHWRLFRTRQ